MGESGERVAAFADKVQPSRVGLRDARLGVKEGADVSGRELVIFKLVFFNGCVWWVDLTRVSP
ncbi:MAG: hypothetical protein ACK4IT_05995 [Thioalkalivibrionaceae bacterium]